MATASRIRSLRSLSSRTLELLWEEAKALQRQSSPHSDIMYIQLVLAYHREDSFVVRQSYK